MLIQRQVIGSSVPGQSAGKFGRSVSWRRTFQEHMSLSSGVRLDAGPAPARMDAWLGQQSSETRGMDVGQVVIFDPAGDTEGIARFLGNHAQHADPAFQRSFQMLSMRIMSWDFD